MNLVVYCRLSKLERDKPQHGMDVQRDKIAQYAALYGHTIAATFEDHGESGKSLERPGLKACLSQLRAGAEGLLVYKLDRLTRSIRDMDWLLSEYFGLTARCPRTLLSVCDQLDTSTAVGRFFLNMQVAVSQWERETIGERTRAALTEKRRQGVLLGRPCKPLAQQHRRGRLVKTMRRMTTEGGLDYGEMAQYLNAEGVVCWLSPSTLWDPNLVEEVLTC